MLNDDVRAFLEEKRFAVLATINRDGTRQQTVMWYELRRDNIIMNTSRGRVKARNLERNPVASVCIADGYTFVTISGHVELNSDQTVAQEDIRRLAVRYHGEEEWNRSGRAEFSKQQRITITLHIEHVIANGL